jgi:tetratricopeptide (TPR) repeat protein
MITNLTIFVVLMQIAPVDAQLHDGFDYKKIFPGGDAVSMDAMGDEPQIKAPACAQAPAHGANGVRLIAPPSELNALGNCYRRLGQIKDAEASFKQAFEMSGSVYIALNLAEVYTFQKRFDEARAVLEIAAVRNPGNGDAYYGIALAYFNENRLEEAEAAALQAHTRAHRIADVHLLLAKIYAQRHPARVVGQLELYLYEAPNGHESKRVQKVLKKLN